MKTTTYLTKWGGCAALALALAFPAVTNAQSQAVNNRVSSQDRQNRIGNVETLNQLFGRSVITSDNKRVGTLQTMVLDLESGRVLYGVLQTTGNRSLTFPPGIVRAVTSDSIRLSVDQSTLGGAPVFKPDMNNLKQLGDASYVAQIYQRFGQTPWWTGSQPAGQGSFNNVFAARQLVRMPVVNVNDRPMGQVRSAAVDLAAGRVLMVVLDPSDELNLGNQLFAIPPNALTRASDGKKLVADVTPEKLASAPRFRTGRAWPIDNREFAASVYQFYGKQPYFQQGQAAGSSQPMGGSELDAEQSRPDYENRWDRDWNRDYDRDRGFDRSRDRDRWEQEDNLWRQGDDNGDWDQRDL
jgi:sporulation protein YlmC with PRC-barrel domain